MKHPGRNYVSASCCGKGKLCQKFQKYIKSHRDTNISDLCGSLLRFHIQDKQTSIVKSNSKTQSQQSPKSNVKEKEGFGPRADMGHPHRTTPPPITFKHEGVLCSSKKVPNRMRMRKSKLISWVSP